MDMASTEQSQKTYRNWLLLTQFIALFVIVGLLFQSSLAPLFARWIKWDEDLSHAIPTLIAFLFLIFRSQALPYRDDPPLLRTAFIAGTLLLSLCWLLFVIANITLLANIALLASTLLLVAAGYSLNTARFLAPLLGILWFVLPLFAEANGLLVAMSADAVGFLVELVGMTALVDGQNIFIPSGHIYIADGCSGLRYFTISLLLGYLLSILNNYNIKETLLTLAIATALGLLTNWVRIFLLVLIGDLTEMKSSLMKDHEFFGWILFACIMLPSIFLAPIRKRKIIRVETPAALKPLAPLLALAIGPALLAAIPNHEQVTTSLSLAILETGEHTMQEKTNFSIQAPPGTKTETNQVNSQGVKVHTHLSEYRPNTLKEKIVPYFDTIYNKEEWVVAQEVLQPELEKRGFRSLILTQASKQAHIALVYRYEIGGYNTAHYETAKALQIPATFSGKRYANFVGMHADCKKESCAEELKATTELSLLWDEKTKNQR